MKHSNFVVSVLLGLFCAIFFLVDLYAEESQESRKPVDLPAKTFGYVMTFGTLADDVLNYVADLSELDMPIKNFGLGMGIEYVLIPRFHLRSTFQFNIRSGSSKVEDTVSGTDEESDLPKVTRFGVSVAGLYDLKKTRLVPYTGGVFNFAFSKGTTITSDVDPITGDTIEVESTEKDISLGLQAVLGARVPIKIHAAFFAQGLLGFSLNIAKSDDDVIKETTKRPQFGTGIEYGGNIGFIFYFF